MPHDAPELADALRAARLPLDHVPTIDLSPIRTGQGKAQMAQDIHTALANIGFMYVTGHGIDPALIQRAFDVTEAFFDLPQPTKDALHIENSGVALHGYTPHFGENTDPTRTRDLKEIFDLGRPAADGQTRPFFGPTPWPKDLPEMREVMDTYHAAMLTLAHHLMRGIALSLGLEENYFEPMMREPIGIQRLLHYPPQDKVEDDRLIGIGAHTDYGCLTILAQDNVGGLQVMHRDGHWVDAPSVPNTFIINIGDMLQQLTNDTYLANLHRVINVSGRERYSIPCFFDVDYDTEFAPLESCVSAEHPAQYAPLICGEHKWARYLASYPHLSAD